MSLAIYRDIHAISDYILMKMVSLSHLKKDKVNIVLSGGKTPLAFFEEISKKHVYYLINWQKIHFWWADERCVSYLSKESNYGEAKKAFFDRIPKTNLHFINGSLDRSRSIEIYENEIKQIVDLEKEFPVFDWIMLGLGSDGHTASIFPNCKNLHSKNIVEKSHHPDSGQKRITLTMRTLNNGKSLDFFVLGKEKSSILKKIICQTTVETSSFPAKFVKPHNGLLTFHTDLPASQLLTDEFIL